MDPTRMGIDLIKKWSLKMTFFDLPINDAIALYRKKHDAAKQGNLEELRKLRNDHPELFMNETEQEMRSMLDYISELRRDPIFQARYLKFCIEEERKAKNFTIVKNENN
jgi:hypothetical protein